jgi:pimeloyl-ACP methyl ester carboxylesterase
MLNEHTLRRDESRSLHYAQGPASGPPLLFLHGVLRCWQDFLPLIPALATRRQVFALDFRGHGQSTWPGRYRVIDYAEDAATMLEQVCPAPAVVYGHSLGAMVALATAAGPAADRCRALVLEDPPFETMGRRIKTTVHHSQFAGMAPLASSTRSVTEVSRALAEVRLSTPGSEKFVRLGDVRDGASLRFSARCLKQVDPEVFEPILAGAWLEGYDLEALLRRVRCPVLLLQADQSTGGMLWEDDTDTVLSLLTDCTHVRLPGVGHLIHWMQTETTLRLVTTFLESLEEEG